MKISWSPLAMERLDQIFEYVSRDNVPDAQKLVERIFDKVETLHENPLRGRIVPEANREEIREVYEGEYRIIYRVEIKRISILSIKNFKQLLKEEDTK